MNMKKRKLLFSISLLAGAYSIAVAFMTIGEDTFGGIVFAVAGMLIIYLGKWAFLPHW